ncbi:MAG: PrsW family intramembrane metalloprotease [Nitrospinae bacterium]|nr:PrsW family intramembrane metalloprotease [Nitrospinota bacterium]
MEILKLMYLAAGPGIALAVYIYYSDKWEPKSKVMVVKAFLLGGLACFPAAYAETVFQKVLGLEGILNGNSSDMWWQKVFYAFIGVALVEELCKFIFLKGFIYDDREFSEPFDGIVFGGILGCGFATVENFFYVFRLGQETGMLRLFTAVPSHVFLGIILGYFMGRAKFSFEPEKELWKGLVLVVILHGIYDTAAFSRAGWSYFVIFGMVFLSIYFGLRAKKDLEKHSAVIEFSPAQFMLVKKGIKKGPLHLKDIRCLLSEGKLSPEDFLIAKKSGKTKSVKEIFSSKIISQYKGLTKIPTQGQSISFFLILYGLTFGLYFYFWFLRNYRKFRNHKGIKINPELKFLELLILSIIPYFVLGMILGKLMDFPFQPFIKVSLDWIIAGIQAAFLFLQLRIIKRFLKRRIKGTFNVPAIVLQYFILDGSIKMLPSDMSYYLFYAIILILFQGVVLALVQEDLNRYWQQERRRLALTK